MTHIGHLVRVGTLSGLLAVASASAGSAEECVNVGPSPGSAQRIGVVDVEQVVAMSRAAREVRDKRIRELERLRQEFQPRGDWIEGMPGLTSRRRQWDRPVFADERLLPSDPAFGPLRDEVHGLVGRLGRERGYDLILDRRGVGALHIASEHDLTEEVLRLYDRQVSATLSGAKPLRLQGD